MKRLKIIMLVIVSVALLGVFGVEIFAAAYLSINVGGKINFTASDIGAQIWGTYAVNNGSTQGNASYVSLSGGEGAVSNNIYEVSGEESSYSNINADVGTLKFTSKSQVLDMFIFIRNTGSRYIIPYINIELGNNYIKQTTTEYLFDISQDNISDPYTLKGNNSATTFANSIKSQIQNKNYAQWSLNSSIDQQDTYCARIQFSIDSSINDNIDLDMDSSFNVSISFVSDIVYDVNNILSVYQNISDTTTSSAWTKYGYNATLGDATPTRIETNSLTNLMTYLENGTNGNSSRTVADKYSELAPIYSKIDLVNIDINTGEIVGKLSDLNYDFEWYGRERTLPSGATLASGRTLTTAETFKLDVYTYYPTVYVRRWVVGDRQWISISEEEFDGAVKIDEHYTATFEATIFDPNKNVSGNANGVIARSYVHSFAPIVRGMSDYFMKYYGFTNTQNYSLDVVEQEYMLKWCSNLTKAWEAYATNNPTKAPYTHKTIKGVQGENYTRFLYNLLYLVKYADNNSQDMVGSGNTYSHEKYIEKSITTSKGTIMKDGVEEHWRFFESIKGGGTIGVYSGSQVGTATYTNKGTAQAPNYVLTGSGYDNGGMNYGYNYEYQYQNGNHIQGLYSNQFLTYNNGSKKYLCDGYAGLDGYTTVFCLGMANPWGNIWTWIFGQAAICDGTNIYMYTKCEDYNYKTNNFVLTNSAGFEYNKNRLINAGYQQLSYSLPTSGGRYNYLDTATITNKDNAINMIIGLPSKNSTKEGYLGDSYDYYVNSDHVFGLLCGGYVTSYSSSGIFQFNVGNNIGNPWVYIGFRTALIS